MLTVLVTGVAVTVTNTVATLLQLESFLWPKSAKISDLFQIRVLKDKMYDRSSASLILFANHKDYQHACEKSQVHLLRVGNNHKKARKGCKIEKMHGGESYFLTMSDCGEGVSAECREVRCIHL